MKTIKNKKIRNILVMVPALMILTGGSAGAAAKGSPQNINLQVHSMEKFHGPAKVHEFKMPGKTIPDGAGSGKGLNDFRPDSVTTVPDAALEELDLHGGETGPVAQLPKGGYFMKMYIRENAFDEGALGDGAMAPGSIQPPVSDPILAGIEHQADMPPDIPSSPVNDKVDPSHLGGPDREPPDDDAGYEEWTLKNQASDISRMPWGSMSQGTRAKLTSILISSSTRDVILIGYKGESGEDKGTGDKDTGDKDTGDKDTGVDTDDEETEEGIKPTADKPVEDEEGGKPDADRDSDPEGDDPDEIMNPASAAGGRSAMVSAMKAEAGFDNTSGGSNGSSSGLPSRTHQGGGLPGVNNVEGSARPDPEDGGPDEMASPASGAINHAMVNGANYQPEPGGGDPDDPRASEGGNTIAVGNLGYAASPAIGDGGGKDPGPIGPEF